MESNQLEDQIRDYARNFLQKEYGAQAVSKLQALEINALNACDTGGVSEANEKGITLAAGRDFAAGKLTDTTKLIVRHELGHILDENSPFSPDFEEEIEHEKLAWQKAKLRNPAENWYKNISIRTHVDPLKMQAIGFPRPEMKISRKNLLHGRNVEVKRMQKQSQYVDENLAVRFAMLHLIENPNWYGSRGSS